MVLSVLLVRGCSPLYSLVEFEVLDPAPVVFPGNVEQLLIMNRAPFTPNAFEQEDVKDLTTSQLYLVDTSVVNNLTKGLRRALRGSPIEQFHHPLWYSERLEDTTGINNLVLTRREVEDLCSQKGADAIIALELYHLNLDLHEDRGTPNMYTKYYELSTRVNWTVYLPGRPRPFNQYSLADTLYFTEFLDGYLIKEHSTLSMIQEACQRSGMRYGRYLVPAWNHASRVIIRGREDALKQAAAFTDQGDWESAYDIWEELAFDLDSTLVAKSCHNMAVYYELEDRLDTAFSLLDRAMAHDSLEITATYREEMEIRIENREDILKQVR